MHLVDKGTYQLNLQNTLYIYGYPTPESPLLHPLPILSLILSNGNGKPNTITPTSNSNKTRPPGILAMALRFSPSPGLPVPQWHQEMISSQGIHCYSSQDQQAGIAQPVGAWSQTLHSSDDDLHPHPVLRYDRRLRWVWSQDMYKLYKHDSSNAQTLTFTKWYVGPASHEASEHVADVIVCGPTLKFATWFVIKLCM